MLKINDLHKIQFKEDAIAVDSLKCRIPFEEIEVIEPSLQGEWIYTNMETGDLDESSIQKRGTFRKEHGFGVRYKLEEQVGNDRKVKKYLTIGLPAKLAYEKYFEGICPNTIEEIHHRTQKHKVARFSLDSLLQSECTDIDYKFDYPYEGTKKDFKEEIRRIQKMTKPSRKQGAGYRSFLEKNNIGIQFSNRKSTSVRTQPFLKIYHKGLDLLSKSKEFSKAHLSELDYENVIRIESTLKNKKHCRYLFGHDVTNLKHIISYPKEDKEYFFKKTIACHLDKLKRPSNKEKVGCLTPIEQVLFQSVKLNLESNRTWDDIKYNLVSILDDRQSKYRKKKQLDKIYSLIIAEEQGEFVPFLNGFF